METDKEVRKRQRTEHREKYEGYAKELGIVRLCALVPVNGAEIRAAIESGDRHLNSIPLPMWDCAHGAVMQMVRSSDTFESGGWSLANTVSLIKHVAIYHYAR